MIRVAWDRREDNLFIGFAAEFVSAKGELISIATCPLSGIGTIPMESQNAAVQSLLDPFIKQIEEFLAIYRSDHEKR